MVPEHLCHKQTERKKSGTMSLVHGDRAEFISPEKVNPSTFTFAIRERTDEEREKKPVVQNSIDNELKLSSSV